MSAYRYTFSTRSLEDLAIAIVKLETTKGKRVQLDLQDVLQDWIADQYPVEFKRCAKKET